MKIDNLGGVGGAGKVAKPKTGGDGSFSKLLDGADNEKQTAAVSGASKLAAINFIQMIDGDEKSKRRKLVDDADDILDELLKIRDDLLLGNISLIRLKAISEKINKLEASCDDPSLNEIIEEVKIRAAVELAKLGVFN